MENHLSNRDQFLSKEFLGIDYKKLPGFLKRFSHNFQNMHSDTMCLAEKNDAFPGHDNFYHWHESFGVLDYCDCSLCRRKRPALKKQEDDLGSLAISHENSEIELPSESYNHINHALKSIQAVHQYAHSHFNEDSIIESIPYKIISTVRSDSGMPCDDENRRVNFTLEYSFLSFYERNIINDCLSLLGNNYATLKQQAWGAL